MKFFNKLYMMHNRNSSLPVKFAIFNKFMRFNPTMASQKAASSSSGAHKAGIPERAGTTVLLLHANEPRSFFYAKNYLQHLLQRHFRLPKWISGSLAHLYLNHSEMPKECIQDSVNYPLQLNAVQQLTNNLEVSVSKLIPEFGPIKCFPASEHEEQFNIEQQLQRAFRQGLDHLILLSISPLLQPKRISTQLMQIIAKIRTLATPLQPSMEMEDAVTEYVLRNSPSSFSLLVVDRLPTSECFIQLFNFTQAAKELESVSRRIMYAAYKESPRTTPWRFAFYPGWELPFIGQLLALNRLSLNNCLKKLQRKGHKGPVLVVPLDSLFQGFNTSTALPNALKKVKNADGFSTNLLQPEAAEDKALVHSLAELIKHVMLNRRKFSPAIIDL